MKHRNISFQIFILTMKNWVRNDVINVCFVLSLKFPFLWWWLAFCSGFLLITLEMTAITRNMTSKCSYLWYHNEISRILWVLIIFVAFDFGLFSSFVVRRGHRNHQRSEVDVLDALRWTQKELSTKTKEKACLGPARAAIVNY